MKKLITAGIAVIACVALCAAVWPRKAQVEDLPAEPVKTAVIGEIGTKSEEAATIFLSVDTHAPELEAVAESEPAETKITTEEKTQKPEHTQTVQFAKPSTLSAEPCMGDARVVNGENQIYIDGFDCIKDEGGGSQGTMVGNPGDELTAWIPAIS